MNTVLDLCELRLTWPKQMGSSPTRGSSGIYMKEKLRRRYHQRTCTLRKRLFK